MEAIRVTDKEWEIAGVHYVRTEAMCNGFGVSLEMEFGEDKAGDEYILVLDGIHPVSTCRLHQLDENTGKIERVATHTVDSIMDQRRSRRQKIGLQSVV